MRVGNYADIFINLRHAGSFFIYINHCGNKKATEKETFFGLSNIIDKIGARTADSESNQSAYKFLTLKASYKGF